MAKSKRTAKKKVARKKKGATKKKVVAKKKLATKKKTGKRAAVWDRPPPKKAKHGHLSPAKKAAAKKAAKRAGRPYPNMVDNMRAARSGKSS